MHNISAQHEMLPEYVDFWNAIPKEEAMPAATQ